MTLINILSNSWIFTDISPRIISYFSYYDTILTNKTLLLPFVLKKSILTYSRVFRICVCIILFFIPLLLNDLHHLISFYPLHNEFPTLPPNSFVQVIAYPDIIFGHLDNHQYPSFHFLQSPVDKATSQLFFVCQFDSNNKNLDMFLNLSC